MDDVRQPDRQPSDGAVLVERRGEKLLISVETDGKTETILCGGFNAFRIFAMMALVLGIKVKIPAKLNIKL